MSKLIQEAQAEERRRPLTLEELRKEDARLARYGEQQAKKLGIKPQDISRIIHEHRDSYGYALRRERYIERRGHEERGGIGIRAPGVSVGIGTDRY